MAQSAERKATLRMLGRDNEVEGYKVDKSSKATKAKPKAKVPAKNANQKVSYKESNGAKEKAKQARLVTSKAMDKAEPKKKMSIGVRG